MAFYKCSSGSADSSGGIDFTDVDALANGKGMLYRDYGNTYNNRYDTSTEAEVAVADGSTTQIDHPNSHAIVSGMNYNFTLVFDPKKCGFSTSTNLKKIRVQATASTVTAMGVADGKLIEIGTLSIASGSSSTTFQNSMRLYYYDYIILTGYTNGSVSTANLKLSFAS